jgi:hypothetical protein
MSSFSRQSILEKGEIFGNLSQLKGKAYVQPYKVISMHPNTQILFLSSEKLSKILSIDPENFRIIKHYIP